MIKHMQDKCNVILSKTLRKGTPSWPPTPPAPFSTKNQKKIPPFANFSFLFRCLSVYLKAPPPTLQNKYGIYFTAPSNQALESVAGKQKFVLKWQITNLVPVWLNFQIYYCSLYLPWYLSRKIILPNTSLKLDSRLK